MGSILPIIQFNETNKQKHETRGNDPKVPLSSLCITVGDYVHLKDGRNGRILCMKSTTDHSTVYGIDTTQSVHKHGKFKNKKEFESIRRDGGMIYTKPYYDGVEVTLDQIAQHFIEPNLTSKDLAQIDKYCKFWFKLTFIKNYQCNLPRITVGDKVTFPYKNWCKGIIKYIGPYSKYHDSEIYGQQKYSADGGPELYFGVKLFNNDPNIYHTKHSAFMVLNKDNSNKTRVIRNESFDEAEKFFFTVNVSRIFFEYITIMDYYNLFQCTDILNLNEWNEKIFPQRLRYNKYIQDMKHRKTVFDEYFSVNERRIQSNRFEIVNIKIKCVDDMEMNEYKYSRNTVLKSMITKFCCELFSDYRFCKKDLKNIVWSLNDAKEYIEGGIKILNYHNHVKHSAFKYDSNDDVKPEKDERQSVYDLMYREEIMCNIFELSDDEFNFKSVCATLDFGRFGYYSAFNGKTFPIFDELKNILILPKTIDIDKWFIGNVSYHCMSRHRYNICMGLLDANVSTENEKVIEETFVMWCMMYDIWES